MKFGEYLLSNRNADWAEAYLDYSRLKELIRALYEKAIMDNYDPDGISKGTSLSVPPPTNAAAQPTPDAVKRTRGGSTGEETQESFYEVLEGEMKKIETFIKTTVRDMRAKLSAIEAEAEQLHAHEAGERGERGESPLHGGEGAVDVEASRKELKERTQSVGRNFLKLEKFVNLNFTGFHKILKKHDRWLPNPCKAFYLTRLHNQTWVRGDYSDVIVSMSSIYCSLRGDERVEEKDSGHQQNFVRSTRKYVSHVTCHL